MKSKIFVLALFCFLAFPVGARASLLGSSFFLSHRFPTIDSAVESYLVTVETGTGDSQVFGSIYTADPEPYSLNIDFFNPFTFDNDPFNGHYADFVPQPITGVTVDTNLTGWDDSRLTMGQDLTTSWVGFNWAGLEAERGSYFYAAFDFPAQNHGGAVPEPATMALFGLGAMGFGVISFRRKQK